MEVAFYVQDEKCSMIKEESCASWTEAGEDSKVVTAAGRTNSYFYCYWCFC